MRFFALPEAVLLEVAGHDSQRYLHARLTNDIKRLTPGAGCAGAALTPQGKIQALFAAYMLADKLYLLECDGGDRAEVVAAFKKYLVADRVEVRDLSAERALFHLIPDTPEEGRDFAGIALPSAEFSVASNGARLFAARRRSPAPGFDVCLGAADVEMLRAELAARGAMELSAAEQLLFRLEANRPAFPQEIAPDTLLSEAPLADAVSHNKGCYVGQEVVEKVDARGKAPKLFRRIVLEGCPEIRDGEHVSRLIGEDRAELGTVLCAASDPAERRTYCFAVLKNRDLTDGMEVEVGAVRGRIL